MSKHKGSSKDTQPGTAGPHTANPDLAEEDKQRRTGQGGEEDIQRRNQSIQDRSLGDPVTGFPGTPKPARR